MKRVVAPDVREVESALDALPLFPLPAVLFPGALLPLHVFEPRYRALVRDVLAGSGALSVVFSAEATGPEGVPRIAKIAGVGRIVDHAELPGGRFNILVQGVARVSLEELPFEPPYRRARARVVSEAGTVSETDASALRAAATSFAARIRERAVGFDVTLPIEAPADLLADLAAHHLVLDARERQAILETLAPAARVRRTTEALVTQRLALSSDPRDMN